MQKHTVSISTHFFKLDFERETSKTYVTYFQETASGDLQNPVKDYFEVRVLLKS